MSSFLLLKRHMAHVSDSEKVEVLVNNRGPCKAAKEPLDLAKRVYGLNAKHEHLNLD
jgi:hypothetical protein